MKCVRTISEVRNNDVAPGTTLATTQSTVPHAWDPTGFVNVGKQQDKTALPPTRVESTTKARCRIDRSSEALRPC